MALNPVGDVLKKANKTLSSADSTLTTVDGTPSPVARRGHRLMLPHPRRSVD